MPGRNMCNLLVLFNLAMWLIDTFQLQNGKSGAVEAEVYGLDSWVLIQRMTVLLQALCEVRKGTPCSKRYTYPYRQNIPWGVLV